MAHRVRKASVELLKTPFKTERRPGEGYDWLISQEERDAWDDFDQVRMRAEMGTGGGFAGVGLERLRRQSGVWETEVEKSKEMDKVKEGEDDRELLATNETAIAPTTLAKCNNCSPAIPQGLPPAATRKPKNTARYPSLVEDALLAQSYLDHCVDNTIPKGLTHLQEARHVADRLFSTIARLPAPHRDDMLHSVLDRARQEIQLGAERGEGELLKGPEKQGDAGVDEQVKTKATEDIDTIDSSKPLISMPNSVDEKTHVANQQQPDRESIDIISSSESLFDIPELINFRNQQQPYHKRLVASPSSTLLGFCEPTGHPGEQPSDGANSGSPHSAFPEPGSPDQELTGCSSIAKVSKNVA